MNSINLTGNVCGDIELRTTTSGKPVVNFHLAVKRPFTKDTTDFIPLVVWDKAAEYLSTYAKKGSKIAVCGKLTTRKYQDKDGNNRTAFEVVADTVEICGKSEETGATPAEAPAFAAAPAAAPENFTQIKPDDDLPF